MPICVTGGTGFLGSALVTRLLAEGEVVRVLARPSPRADELEKRGAELVRGSLGDPEARARAVEGSEMVYHLAAKVTPPGSQQDFFEANVSGTECVLAECLKRKVARVIYVSSLAVYGPIQKGQRIDEETPLDEKPERRDFYSRSKIWADIAAASFARAHGLPLVIIRPGIVFGAGRPLPAGLLGFRIGESDFVFGHPDNRIPLNYRENLVDAMLAAARSKGSGLQQFNIVDDESLTLGQYHATRAEREQIRTIFLPGWPVLIATPFTELLRHLIPREGIAGLTRYQIRRALQDRWYVTRRIREGTEWTPKVPLKEAIARSLGPAI